MLRGSYYSEDDTEQISFVRFRIFCGLIPTYSKLFEVRGTKSLEHGKTGEKLKPLKFRGSFNSFQERMNIKTISSNFGLILFLIVCLEAFVVLIVLNQASSGILGGDAWFYNQTAISMIQNGSYSILNENNVLEPTLSKPPGYSIFLAFVYLLSGNSIIAVRIVQFILLWLIGVGIYRLSKRFVDESTSKVSAILSVTYLPLVFLSIYHLSEVLATFLLVWTVCKAIDCKEYGKRFDVISAALLFAFLSLVRPNWALFVIPIFGIIYLSKRKGTLPNLILFPIVCALLISPWLIRNYILTGQVIMSSVAKQTLYLSVLQYEGKISYAFTFEEYAIFVSDLNQRMGSIDEQTNLTTGKKTLIDKELLLEESYQSDFIAERQNLTFAQIFSSVPKRIAYFWSTSDISPTEIYGSFYHRIAQIQYLLITALILFGLFLRRKLIKADWFLTVPAIYITFIHLVFLLEPRYSIPARPFLFIFAAVGIVWITNKRELLWGRSKGSVA